MWNALLFYEQIGHRPPLPLRLLLPVPLRAEEALAGADEETRCVYENGHLLKRMTRVLPPRHRAFVVVDQKLEIAGGIRLEGGSYNLDGLPDGSTRLALETRYVSPRRPRWLWGPIEASVCHAFHRQILGAIRRGAEDPRGATSALLRIEYNPNSSED